MGPWMALMVASPPPPPEVATMATFFPAGIWLTKPPSPMATKP